MNDSVWGSICVFTDQPEGPTDVHEPPLAYLGSHHYLLPTDPRGGLFDVAEVVDWQSCLDPVRALRFTIISPDGERGAACGLDLVQVAQLYNRLGAWLGVDKPAVAVDLT